MIGLDTNVLVRLLTGDDAAQYAAVRSLIEDHRDEPEAFFLNDLVLAETWWVLSRRYRLAGADILDALNALATNLGYAFENRERLLEAIGLCREGKADFADALIALCNRQSGCTHTVTFDARFARLDMARRLGT